MPVDPLDHQLAERQLTHLIDSARLSSFEAACRSDGDDGDDGARREARAEVHAREEDRAHQVRRDASRSARRARAAVSELS